MQSLREALVSQHSRLSHSPHPGANGGKGQTKPCSGHYNLRMIDELFNVGYLIQIFTTTDNCNCNRWMQKEQVCGRSSDIAV